MARVSSGLLDHVCQDLILPTGEAAEFDTSALHWLGSADGGVVELLILFGMHGVRAHVRGEQREPVG